MRRNDTDHHRISVTMTIRRVGDAERAEVERIAQRDSAQVPVGPLLGAEVDGRLLAVTSLAEDRTIADPFARSAEARAVLELRAAQLRRPNGHPRLPLRIRRRSRGALPSSPPGAGGRLLTLSVSRE